MFPACAMNALSRRGEIVFPACAGMNRALTLSAGAAETLSVPRLRGDEPGADFVQSCPSGVPRLRGDAEGSRQAEVFPACAGMNRS